MAWLKHTTPFIKGTIMEKEIIIREKMIEAMKAHNQEDKETLSLLLSALKNAKIEKRRELTEDEENTVVQKEIRQTQETIDSCPEDRVSLLDKCKRRIELLSQFTPKQMNEEEIEKVINEAMATLGFNHINIATKKDKGKIMKVLMPLVKGKADGRIVSKVIDRILK